MAYTYLDLGDGVRVGFDGTGQSSPHYLGSSAGDTIIGTWAGDFIECFEGNDWVIPGPGDDFVEGGPGTDEVLFTGYRAEYSISVEAGNVIRTKDLFTGRDGNDTLRNVERLTFADGHLAFDTAGTAGVAYRLYQAAFNRVPDKAGLGYQMKLLDGGASLHAVAQSFIDSAEFSGKYGALNNAAFVTQLYQNVLHRAPDEAGLAYHRSNLDSGASRADVLVTFSESSENQAALIGTMSAGMAYT